MHKLQLTGRNLGWVFNSRSGHVYATHSCHYWAKLSNFKLKTRPKQLLGSLQLDSNFLPFPTIFLNSFWWVLVDCLFGKRLPILCWLNACWPHGFWPKDVNPLFVHACLTTVHNKKSLKTFLKNARVGDRIGDLCFSIIKV